MHTYRKADGGWQAGYQHSDDRRWFTTLGPLFSQECEAAALASFLNGGRYSPGEIELVFVLVPPEEDDDDSIHHDRPKAFDNDYPLEATQRHK